MITNQFVGAQLASLIPASAKIKVLVGYDHGRCVQKIVGLREHKESLENIRKELKKFTIEALKVVNQVPTETCESRCFDELK